MKFGGKVEKAYGEQLETPVDFTATFQRFETAQEVREGNEWPKDKDVVQWANAKRKAAARATAVTAALTAAGINPPAKDDPKVLTRDFIRTLTNAGKTRSQALEIAKNALGDKFYGGVEAEEDEDEDENGETA